MNKCDADTVLMDLPAEDFAAAATALAAVGIAGAALDTAGSECIGGFLLIGADAWDRVRAWVEPRAYTVILIVPPEREGAAAGLLEQGVFDSLVGGNPGWAERAAAYFHALMALDRRFAGGISKLERRYEDLVHSLPDIVYELDSEGRFTFVNNSISLLGYEPSDLLGKHFSMLLDDEDAETVDRSSVLEAFRGITTGPGLSPKLFNERRSIERRTENLEVRLRPRPKPGARVGSTEDLIVTVISYGEVTAAGEYTMRSSIRDFMGSVGVIRDISLRRKSEAMLRKLYQAVDQLSAGILVADRSFLIEYVNPGFFRITGLSPQEVIGAELFSFFDFPPGKAAEIRSLVLEGFDAEIELRLARSRERSSGSASGTAQGGPWVALHASPVRAPSGLITHAILICEDISQRKAMEELISLAKEEAERANGAKSDFLASMSHELKSPVASVLAAARLIEMGGPEPERRAASIIASAQGLLDMLGDILDFARFETGTGTLRKYAFPLAGFVARICGAARKRAEAKGLGFEVGSIPDETLRSDPDRLGRAFAAILDNAVSFTENGKVRVEAAIERRQGNVPYLTLSVSDTGPGILPEDQGRIFSPFVQLASPYTKRGGAGIGLSLAHTIVRALGGEVRIQSDVGRGSVFTLLVPVGDLDVPSAAAHGPAYRPENRRAYRLLVVDDNEVNLEYMAAILANSGHRTLTAASGAEALRLLEEMPPDAAILDIQMPGMSGIDLGRKIRDYSGGRYDPNLPLVALTAFDSEEVGRSGIDFDGVFDKPVDVPKLLSFLDTAVDLRESPSASAFAAHWAGRAKEGERILAAALEEIPGLAAKVKDAIAAEDVDAMRPAARALGAQLRLLGDERGAAAFRRLALAVSDEDRAVMTCRAERLASNCALVLRMLKSLLNG
ncbi:MAG: PAS domain S-box protein [Rectinemataceae bacterium]|jgi:PAS domain S-box-containing protein